MFLLLCGDKRKKVDFVAGHSIKDPFGTPPDQAETLTERQCFLSLSYRRRILNSREADDEIGPPSDRVGSTALPPKFG